jgi:predicted Zn-dependent protease
MNTSIYRWRVKAVEESMSPEEFKTICDKAEGYIELGLLDEALNMLEDLPTQAKISKEVIIVHMTILVKSGQPLKASYLGENLCFGDPENVGLMLEVGQLKHDAGEFTEALKWLNSVEAKCSDSAQFHLIRAKCHASLGDHEACALALREAHRIEPDLRMQSLNDPAFEAIYWAANGQS